MTKKSEVTVEEKLRALYDVQLIDSRIDEIRNVRGELPLEVADLEDEVQGLTTRLDKLKSDLDSITDQIAEKKNLIEASKAAIKKYTEQQKNVRNNREFDSLSKEIEFQGLEIELSEKKINESKVNMEHKMEIITTSKEKLEERQADLDLKRKELEEIAAETEKDEQKLIKKSEKARKNIEDRLITAYDRLRNNSKNGLAVVSIERDACGGCFNKIPPQRQLDIKAHKKLIVCEHCGRILVEPAAVEVKA
jgi:predicted  nucleic acid-binding Zn-ribbon protein